MMKSKTLPEEYWLKYINLHDFYTDGRYIDEDTLYAVSDNMFIQKVSKKQNLSEEFIEKAIKTNKLKVNDISTLKYHEGLSDEFLEKYAGYISWNNISKTCKMSLYILEKFKDKICWKSYLREFKLTTEEVERLFYYKNSQWMYVTQTVPEHIITQELNKLCEEYNITRGSIVTMFSPLNDILNTVFQFQELSMNFIMSYLPETGSHQWYTLAKFQKLSTEFIKMHSDKLQWDAISRYQNITNDLAESCEHLIHWYLVGVHSAIDESIIKKYADKLDWMSISCTQHLSIELMDLFKDKIHWRYVKNMSDDILERYMDFIHWNTLDYGCISETMLRKHIDKIYWGRLSLFTNHLSDDFICEYGHKLTFNIIAAERNLTPKVIKSNINALAKQKKIILSRKNLSEEIKKEFINLLNEKQ